MRVLDLTCSNRVSPQLAEQAEELQCVGNARDAACADQARLTDELADSGKRVRELVRFCIIFASYLSLVGLLSAWLGNGA